MAEFAASLESGAAVEKLPSQQAIINGQTNMAQGAIARMPQSNTHNGSGLEDERTLQQLDEVTLAAAKSARDYRTSMLENLEVNIAAASDCANGFASANLPPGFAGMAAGQPRNPEADNRTLERKLPVAAPPAEDYRAKAVELINANVNATLDYAQRLGNVTSAAEFIELSTNHAYKHFELMMKHAAAVMAFSCGSPTNE
jgi:Phasin protein